MSAKSKSAAGTRSRGHKFVRGLRFCPTYGDVSDVASRRGNYWDEGGDDDEESKKYNNVIPTRVYLYT